MYFSIINITIIYFLKIPTRYRDTRWSAKLIKSHSSQLKISLYIITNLKEMVNYSEKTFQNLNYNRILYEYINNFSNMIGSLYNLVVFFKLFTLQRKLLKKSKNYPFQVLSEWFILFNYFKIFSLMHLFTSIPAFYWNNSYSHKKHI